MLNVLCYEVNLLENTLIVEKYCRTRQATDGSIAHAHCMLDTLGSHKSAYVIRYAFAP